MPDMHKENETAGNKQTPALANRPGIGEDAIDIYALLLRFLANWFWIVLFSVIGAVAAYMYTSYFIAPTYQTIAKLYIKTNEGSLVNISDLQLGSYLANDYEEVFDVWEVQNEVKEKLQLDYSCGQIGGMITVTNPQSTRILYITATSTDPQEACDIANAYAEVASEYIKDKMEAAVPRVLQTALKPTSPSSPNKTKNAMTGFAAGLILICALIYIKFISDDYIRTAEDIEKYVHLPTLGTILLQDQQDGVEQKHHKRRHHKER